MAAVIEVLAEEDKNKRLSYTSEERRGGYTNLHGEGVIDSQIEEAILCWVKRIFFRNTSYCSIWAVIE